MISWWWLMPAFALGAMMGVLLTYGALHALAYASHVEKRR